MRDIEQELRESLQARAQDVRPDPETWNRVQRRIRRRQTVRVALGGLAAAAAVVVAAVVLPGVLRGTLVDIDTGPADQPTAPTEPVPTPAPDAQALLAVADEHGVRLLGGDSLVPGADRVAIRPGASADRLTVATRDVATCALQLTTLVDGQVDRTQGLAASMTDCQTAPVWSPEGDALAWMDGAEVRVLRWAGQPEAGDAPLETVGWPIALNLDDARITDWVWTVPGAPGGPVQGVLYLTGTIGDGSARAFALQIDRQGDGAFAIAAEAAVVADYDVDDGAWRVVARADGSKARMASQSAGLGGGEGVEYALLVTDTGRVAVAGVERDTWAYAELEIDAATLEDNRAWLAAHGHEVAVGDGVGGAWRLTLAPDGGFSDPVRLDGNRLVHGDLLRTDGQPVPPADLGGLPAPVADTRGVLVGAARAGDVEALAERAAEDGTNLSFGGPPEDLVAWFERLAEQGELDRLAALLTLPHAEQDGLFVWPYAHARDLRSLSSAELTELSAVAPLDEIEQWAEAGTGWMGWRVGIAADGTWAFYVAGD
jgi:hypothetical protein